MATKCYTAYACAPLVLTPAVFVACAVCTDAA